MGQSHLREHVAEVGPAAQLRVLLLDLADVPLVLVLLQVLRVVVASRGVVGGPGDRVDEKSFLAF